MNRILLYGGPLVLVAWGLYSLGSILIPFGIGLLGAYFFDGPVSYWERRNIPRWLSSLLTVLGILLLIVTLMGVAIPYLQKELSSLAQIGPSLLNQWVEKLEPFQKKMALHFPDLNGVDLRQHLVGQFGDMMSWGIGILVRILGSGFALANALSLAILTPLICFYMLKDWPLFLRKLNSLLPSTQAPLIRNVVHEVDKSVKSYYRSQFKVCLWLMGLYSSGLLLVGLPQAVIIGVLTGLLSFVPYIGMLIGLLYSLGIAYSHGLPLLPVLGVFGAVQMIDGNVLTPRLLSGGIGLHPVWILFALLAGGNWFGFWGILFAIPVAATLKTLLKFIHHRSDWVHPIPITHQKS
jgi:predicted PurR-regulated permease PerM